MATNADFKFPQGDTLPIIKVQALQANGNPVDLTNVVDGGGSILFYMATPGAGGTLVIDGHACTVDGDPADGWIWYTFQAGETNDLLGVYEVKIRVIYPDPDLRFSLPRDGFLTVEFTRNLPSGG